MARTQNRTPRAAARALARTTAAATLAAILAATAVGAGAAQPRAGESRADQPTSQVVAAAKWKAPKYALAKVAGAGTQLEPGYGLPCAACSGFGFNNSSGGDPWATGIDDSGRLVTARLKERSVVVLRHASPTAPATSRKTLTVPKGWSVEGFHFGSDGTWYLASARSNPKESKTRAVVQVRRYSQSLQLMGTITVQGALAKTHVPFRSGNGAMTVHQGALWLLLPETEFKRADKLNHQAAYLLRLDFASGKAEKITRLASHSFGQFIASDGSRLVTAEHGDGYPRAIQVAEHIWSVEYDWAGWDWRETFPVKFPGRTGDNFTGATLSGLALGSTTSLTTGVSQPQKKSIKGVKGQNRRLKGNVWVGVSNPSTGATSFRWITTNHPKKTKTQVTEPRLVRLAPDRFALVHGSRTKKAGSQRTHYLLLDGQGRTLAKKTFTGEFSPLAQPVLQGSRLVWINQFSSSKTNYRTRGSYLVALDVTTPAEPKRLSRG